MDNAKRLQQEQEKPHLSLGATSAAILKAIKTDGGIVFPARGAGNKTFSGFSKAKAQLNEKIIKLRKKDDKLYKLVPWTLHDLRRTLATNGRASASLPNALRHT